MPRYGWWRHLDGLGHGVGHRRELVLRQPVAKAPCGPSTLSLAVAAASAGGGGDNEPLYVVRGFAPAETCGWRAYIQQEVKMMAQKLRQLLCACGLCYVSRIMQFVKVNALGSLVTAPDNPSRRIPSTALSITSGGKQHLHNIIYEAASGSVSLW